MGGLKKSNLQILNSIRSADISLRVEHIFGDFERRQSLQLDQRMEIKTTSTLSSPVHVQHYLSSLISFEREEFWVLAINNQLELIKAECLFRGTVNECPIYPRDIFRFACITNASGLILCHSHPSGSPKPSGEDIKVTRQILRASKLLKIPIQDHVILTKDSLYSFRLDGKI